MPTAAALHRFQAEVEAYYRQQARDLPWRQTITTPYQVLVSEFMLQQTQVSRVIPKYHEFLARFPTLKALSQASLAEVLTAWSGLGYNRRAKYLWQTAGVMTTDYQGHLPADPVILATLPGIGPNTAGAIYVYSFNKPAVFIETNIRTVFLHHFFKAATDVSDQALRPLIEATVPTKNPRQWYWALMDYGSYLKKQRQGSITASHHYRRQSKFHGSSRQLRGQVIRQLTLQPHSQRQLKKLIPDERLAAVLTTLKAEGFITIEHNLIQLAS